MNRALSQSSHIQVVETTGIIETDGAQDVTFIAVGATSFKVQGRAADGVTYNDLEDTALTGDGTPAQRLVLSMFRSHFTHMKVIMVGSGATCAVIRHGLRQIPHSSVLADGDFEDYTHHIIDPQVGTA